MPVGVLPQLTPRHFRQSAAPASLPARRSIVSAPSVPYRRDRPKCLLPPFPPPYSLADTACHRLTASGRVGLRAHRCGQPAGVPPPPEVEEEEGNVINFLNKMVKMLINISQVKCWCDRFGEMLHPTFSLNKRWCKSFNSKKKLVQLSMNNTGLALLFEKCCNIFFA